MLMGALGSHLLYVSDPQLFALAREIHAVHVLFGLVLLVAGQRLNAILAMITIALILVGILLFSGTLYLKASGHDIITTRLVPVGGMMLMASWVLAIIAALTGSGTTQKRQS